MQVVGRASTVDVPPFATADLSPYAAEHPRQPALRAFYVAQNTINLPYGEKTVVSALGDTHRRLHAAMSPGFTAATVKNYLPAFESRPNERLERSSGSSTNVCPLLSTGTLAAVSEAVLGYSLEDLGPEFMASDHQ
ncbi:hypothetical protein B0H10DRAFT_2230476 [Mycena sp. CBHHK59/15]|nr:hypothetical protein B0H10DRAFT_2230476 [Mycena sp. CBHHK59/15]